MIRIGRSTIIVCVLIFLFFVPSIFSNRRESQPNDPCKIKYSTTLTLYIFHNVININSESIQVPEKACLTVHFFGYVKDLNMTSKWMLIDGKINNDIQTMQISVNNSLKAVTFDPPEYHTDFSISLTSIHYNSTTIIDVRVGKGSVYYDTVNFAYYIFLVGMIRYVIIKQLDNNRNGI